MRNFFTGNSLLQYFLWAVFLTGTLVILFKPNNFLFKVGENFMVQIMMTYLGVGLLSLILSDTKSTFVSFSCCAIICLGLRTRAPFYSPIDKNVPTFTIANFNVSNSNSDLETTAKEILNSNADLISIQVVTPDWDLALKEILQEKYPYDTTFVRIDLFGAAIYSKFPLENIDTFHCEEIPNIVGTFTPKNVGLPVYFITSHTNPPVSLAAFDKINKHLMLIAEKAKYIKYPIVTLGDYNVVPWSKEVLSFRQKAGLHDSRRDNPPNSATPIDHIFYSDQLNCINFKSFFGKRTGQIGIIGAYQLKYTNHAQGIFQ